VTDPKEETAWPGVEGGKGRPIVFLHGYPLSHAMWTPQLESLARTNRVLLFDFPGYGVSEAAAVPDSLSGFAEVVRRALSRHVREPVVLVGHSFGGYVALELLRRSAEGVAALVLTNTRSGADSAEAREKRLGTALRLSRPGERLDLEATARALVAPSHSTAGGPLRDQVDRMVARPSPPTLVRTLTAMAHRPDLTPVLSTLRIPTLVIWGEEDQLILPAESRSMLAHLSDARGVGIPGAGHLPSLEAPGEFNRTVTEFVART
jgi:3-oxoadipate enol-lactonase